MVNTCDSISNINCSKVWQNYRGGKKLRGCLRKYEKLKTTQVKKLSSFDKVWRNGWIKSNSTALHSNETHSQVLNLRDLSHPLQYIHSLPTLLTDTRTQHADDYEHTSYTLMRFRSSKTNCRIREGKKKKNKNIRPFFRAN